MVKLKFNQPVEVDFNLHGQTIDGSSITLASYIGILAREYIPITLESWKKVDEQKKDMIWSSLLDEINQLRESTCPPNDNNINEDSLVKVLGAEKRGRVRGLGFGATSSQAELKATNDQVASLKDMIMKQNDQVICRISSTNSKDKIHNMPLGKGYWRIWIDAVSIDIKVCRSTDEYEMLSQAVGSSVAWFKDCIKIFAGYNNGINKFHAGAFNYLIIYKKKIPQKAS
ncbi:hypothetical protein ACOSQ4_003666 [Xanthoceras sorbifolium]